MSNYKSEFLEIHEVDFAPQDEESSVELGGSDLDRRQDDLQLKAVLQSFEMELLFPFLKAADVTFRSLRYLSVDDINVAIRSVGYRAEFREKLFAWRRIKYKTNDITIEKENTIDLSVEAHPVCVTKSIKRTATSPLMPDMESDDGEHSVQYELRKSCVSSKIEVVPVRNCKSLLDLNKVLEQSHFGPVMKSFYKKNGYLDRKHRDELIQIIVDYLTANDIKMRCSDFYLITNEIVSIFPNEEDAKDYYFIGRKGKRNPMGRLYTKYYNTIKKRRLHRTLEESIQDNSSSADAQEEAYNAMTLASLDDSSLMAIKSFLRCDSIDWDVVCTMWEKTCAARRDDIQLLSTKELLTQWPKYLMPRGIELFNIDFNSKYPRKTEILKRKWPEFQNKICNYYHLNIKDEMCKGLFTIFKTKPGKNIEAYLLIVLLNAIMPPTARFRDSIGTNRRKASIADAVECFAIRVNDLNQLDERRDELICKYSGNKELLMAPNIVIVGSSDIIREVYVGFESMLFEMPDFITAIDVCLKIFRVLDIPYPLAIQYPWTFMQIYFYDILLSDDTKCPAMSSLMAYLKY